QGILGVLYAAKINNSEIFIELEQAELLINLKSFQIDILYKYIKDDGYKKLFNALFNTIQELTNQPLYIYHIHGKETTFDIYVQIMHYTFSMKFINAPFFELVEYILNTIISLDKAKSISNIELEERKIALLERQTKLRKEIAKAKAIELQNQQLKI
ncbi:46260_t:CDS:2, partial [Gigaspora margarita]